MNKSRIIGIIILIVGILMNRFFESDIADFVSGVIIGLGIGIIISAYPIFKNKK